MPSSVSQNACSALTVLLVGCSLLSAPRSVQGQGRDRFLELAEQAYQNGLTTTAASVERWESTYAPDSEFGYIPPGAPPYMARLAGLLYQADRRRGLRP